MSAKISLEGRKGLVVGIANDRSIAYGCAKAVRELGADLCVTYMNEKSLQYMGPLADNLGAELILPLDVTSEAEMDLLFGRIEETWGKLDFVIHSIAWSPLDELHGRLVDSSAEGFCKAIDISCHSFIRMANRAEKLMKDGGTLVTMSYHGSEKVVEHYNMMGPIKAALESSVRYLAAELGEKNIRVHSISPGPMPTRAASGIDQFDALMDDAIERSPLHQLGTPEDVGNLAAFLVSDMGQRLTGNLVHVDAGHHIMA